MAKDNAGAAVETPPAKGAPGAPAGTADAGAPAKEPAPKSSGNKWTDLGTDIAQLGKVKDLGELGPEEEAEKEKGEKPAKHAKPAKPAKPAKGGGDEETDDERAEREAEEAAGRAKKKPDDEEELDEEERAAREKAEREHEEGKEPEKGAGRYTVLAEDGAEFEFEALPKGAKIVFKAGGKKVEVTSMDDLVGLAQQVPGLRQMEASYQGKLKTATATQKALVERLTLADKAFREILEDDEKLEKFRARAAKLNDPEYREGLEAKRKLGAKEQAEAEEAETVVEQVKNEFWEEAENQFTALLEQYPTLSSEDFPDVKRAFWDDYTAHRDGLEQQALEEMGTDELTEEQAEALDRRSFSWFTEEHFEAVVRRLHEQAERRAVRTGGGNGRRKAATQEEADAAEVEAHNKHVDDKLRQRDTRTLKGKGAPPGRGGEREERPSTWAGHMASISEEFEKIKKAPVAD